MTLKRISALLLVILSAALTLPSADLSYTGLSQTKLAMGLDDGSFPYYEQKVDLSIDIYKNMSHLFIQPYISLDQEESVEFDMRELYVDFYLDTMDIRVGKQIIATGQADGLYLTNIISPLNLSDFLFSEMHELQQGVPAVKASYYHESFTFTGMWISHFVPTEIFSSDSPWYNPPSLPDAGTVTMNAPEVPEFSIENSEIFAKASYFGSLATVDLIWGYTWSDEPCASTLTITSPSPFTADIDTEYGRYSVAGTALSAPISSAILRTEILASFNKPFSAVTTSPSPSVTMEKHSIIDGLIGLDLDLAGYTLSLQYRGTYIINHNDSLIVSGRSSKEYAQLATLNVQKSFLDDTLTAQVFTIIEFKDLNAMIRPSLTYDIEDAVEVTAETILFVGNESGMYGSYKDRSVLAFSLNYYF